MTMSSMPFTPDSPEARQILLDGDFFEFKYIYNTKQYMHTKPMQDILCAHMIDDEDRLLKLRKSQVG